MVSSHFARDAFLLTFNFQLRKHGKEYGKKHGWERGECDKCFYCVFFFFFCFVFLGGVWQSGVRVFLLFLRQRRSAFNNGGFIRKCLIWDIRLSRIRLVISPQLVTRITFLGMQMFLTR